MNDPLLVRGLERVCDLPRDRQRFLQRNRSLRDAVGQRRPLDQFQYECLGAVRVLEPVDRCDVRMVQ
jgi:hypothetical protein